MHLLYVTDLVVTPADTPSGAVPYERLVDHAADWLSRGGHVIHANDLTTDGHATLSEGYDGESRAAVWTVIEAPTTRVLLIEVAQRVAQNVMLTTRVTIGDVDGVTSFRVGIARESDRGGALTPVGFTPVFQPGIVGAVTRDLDLHLHVGGQSVSDRYLQLPSPRLVDDFAKMLDSSQRLPVLLVNTRTQPAWNFAREVAWKLVGLVRVVTLANYTRGRLAALRPHIAVPPGGARLVWSEAHVPGPTWGEERILSSDAEDLRSSVMRVVAPLSALYRGTDHVWQDARRRAQRLETESFARRVAAAQSSADQSELVVALQGQVGALTSERDEFEHLAEEYASEAASVRDRAERLDSAEAEAKYWRELYIETQAVTPTAEVDLWSVIPPLVPRADPAETFRAIEAAADDRVVFTPAAATSWSKISYPEPEDMLEKLLGLANAAVDLYSEDPGTIGRIDEWFKTRHGLNVATADDTIQKTKALRNFQFDGHGYDQTPHVKVRDGVKPNQVGRIHFAMDSDKKRFVINHVALKLYGI